MMMMMMIIVVIVNKVSYNVDASTVVCIFIHLCKHINDDDDNSDADGDENYYYDNNNDNNNDIGGAIGNAATAWSIFLIIVTFILRKLYPNGVKLLEHIKKDAVSMKHQLDKDIDKMKHHIDDDFHDVKIKIQHELFGRSIDRNDNYDDDDDDDHNNYTHHLQQQHNTSAKRRYTSNKIHPIDDTTSLPSLPSSSSLEMNMISNFQSTTYATTTT